MQHLYTHPFYEYGTNIQKNQQKTLNQKFGTTQSEVCSSLPEKSQINCSLHSWLQCLVSWFGFTLCFVPNYNHFLNIEIIVTLQSLKHFITWCLDNLQPDFKITNLFKKWLDYILMSKNLNNVNIFWIDFSVFITVCIKFSRNSQRPEFIPSWLISIKLKENWACQTCTHKGKMSQRWTEAQRGT